MTDNNGTFDDVWDLNNTSITNLKKDKKNDNELKDKKKDLFDDVLDYYEPSNNKKKENTEKSKDKNNTTITQIKPIAKPKSKKKKKILPKLVIDDY